MGSATVRSAKFKCGSCKMFDRLFSREFFCRNVDLFRDARCSAVECSKYLKMNILRSKSNEFQFTTKVLYGKEISFRL